jgi:hypothetical protein
MKITTLITGLICFTLATVGHAHSLNSDLTSNIADSAGLISLEEISNNEIILLKENARVVKGENTIIPRKKFIIDSVEVEIFPRSGSLDNESPIEEGVTIAELVEALHYLDMKPERIIQFLQNAINAGMINGKLLLK